MTHTEALYNLKPLTRFTDKAGNYAKYRPTYPDAAIDKILEGLASPSQLVAADIGAGTGISARQLAERGVNVIAIEPNPAIRDAARNVISTDATYTDATYTDATYTDTISTDATYTDTISTDATYTDATYIDGTYTDGTSTDGTYTDGTSTDATYIDGTYTDGTSTDGTYTDGTSTDGTSTDGTSTDGTSTDGTCRVSTLKSLVEWRDGTAEATNLPDASVDLITCFQAFHWFKPEPTLLEFRRILKSSGRLVLVFNDLNRDDEFTKKYHKLILVAANNRPPTDFSAKVQPLRDNPQWRYLQCHTFTYQQELDLAKLIGLAKSVSFISSEEKSQKQLVSDLEDLYQRLANKDGFVSLGYRTSVHVAELNS